MRVFILLLLLTTNACLAEIYQWRDKQGNIHFGDRPPEGAATRKVTVKPITYKSPEIVTLDDALYDQGRIVMYSASWCPVCKRARAWFEANGIAFVEYDIEHSAKGRRDYHRMGARGVPVILVGDHRLNGFSVAAFKHIYHADRGTSNGTR